MDKEEIRMISLRRSLCCVTAFLSFLFYLMHGPSISATGHGTASRRGSVPTTGATRSTLEERLSEADGLLAGGIIKPKEHERLRARLIEIYAADPAGVSLVQVKPAKIESTGSDTLSGRRSEPNSGGPELGSRGAKGSVGPVLRVALKTEKGCDLRAADSFANALAQVLSNGRTDWRFIVGDDWPGGSAAEGTLALRFRHISSKPVHFYDSETDMGVGRVLYVNLFYELTLPDRPQALKGEIRGKYQAETLIPQRPVGLVATRILSSISREKPGTGTLRSPKSKITGNDIATPSRKVMDPSKIATPKPEVKSDRPPADKEFVRDFHDEGFMKLLRKKGLSR